MLAKKARLNRVEFTDYFKKGQRFNGSVSTLIYLKEAEFKASVVVGKKLAKKAVMRNRLRRLGYRVINEWQTHHQITGVLIMLVKPTITTLSRKEQAEAFLKDLGLLLK